MLLSDARAGRRSPRRRSAGAGTYDVYACGGPAGAAQRAFAAAADPQMEAYSICPPQSGVGTGIATKATSRGRDRRLTAPAPIRCSRRRRARRSRALRSTSARSASTSYWSVGIVAFDGDFNSTAICRTAVTTGRPGCGVGTPTFSIRVNAPLLGHTRFRFETRCFNPAGCDVSASPFSPANRALFSAANVVVRVQDETALRSRPTTARSGRTAGTAAARRRGPTCADNVGIVSVRLLADGGLVQALDFRDPSWPEWAQCDFTLPKPCKDFDPGGLWLDTATLADGEHAVRFEAIDAAGNVAAIERRILVDNTRAGEGLRGDGRRRGGVASGERLHGALAEPARAGGADRPRRTTSSARSARRRVVPAALSPASGIDGLAHLTVPAPGEYTLRTWLEDAAGNHDPDRASDPVRLRFDDEAPSVVFQPFDPGHPTRVAAAIADRGSGIADAAIEIRADGGSQWQELGGSLRDGTLAAEVDDLALPDGLYELRARARDRAGNERTGDRRGDGSRMQLRLPLRLGAGVLLSHRGRPRCRRAAHGRKRRCRAPAGAAARIVVHSRRAQVDGLLQNAFGEPIRHARITVSQQLRTGGGRQPLAAIESDGLGRFSLTVPAGPSRSIRFAYGGHAARQAGDRRAQDARAGRLLDPRRPPRGRGTATRSPSRGRLDGGHVPEGGKLIDLQAYYRGGWRTFATPRCGLPRPLVLSLSVRRHAGHRPLPLPGANQARGRLPVRARVLTARAESRSGAESEVGCGALDAAGNCG